MTDPGEAALDAERSAPRSDDELEALLSEPTEGVLAALERRAGDVVVLGAGGKMGPSLARMVRRALDRLGRRDRVLAVSRFSDAALEERLQGWGIETLRCDLTDYESVAALPDAPSVIYMAGQKFGTAGRPAATWATNVVAPAIALDRYRTSRVVAFSTGNVYPLTTPASGGSLETDEPGPTGEYGFSALGRERVLDYYSVRNGTRVAIMRLNYAVDLRYGVLTDIALRVFRGEPVDTRMGYVNVCWQGDANARAIRLLEHAASPPFVLNVAGSEVVGVRALASRFGDHFRRAPQFVGREAPDALLSNAARADRMFGVPTVPLEQLIAWTAAWVRRGGTLLGKPTHFEARDGRF